MALQPSEIVLKTPQFDSRFPNLNQMKNSLGKPTKVVLLKASGLVVGVHVLHVSLH